jgi:hypothetical protein
VHFIKARTHVLSTAPGHGTTATLVLPLGERTGIASIIAGHGPMIMEEPNGQAHSRAKTPESAEVSKVPVLVADDHAMVRQGL